MKTLETMQEGEFTLAVLDTPMWPCRYYGGIVFKGIPIDNSCGNYYRTIGEAVDGMLAKALAISEATIK
jgi:hypothetical protein